MATTQRQLAEALFELLVGTEEAKQGEVITKFIHEITQRGLLTDTDRFLRTFENILRARVDDENLRVTVAHEVTIFGADVVVDPSLIGGAKAEQAGRVSDASVSGRLDQIRKSLIANGS